MSLALLVSINLRNQRNNYIISVLVEIVAEIGVLENLYLEVNSVVRFSVRFASSMILVLIMSGMHAQIVLVVY